MALAPTRLSRLSLGFIDSVKSVIGADPADTGAVLSVEGDVVISGTLSAGASSPSGVSTSALTAASASITTLVAPAIRVTSGTTLDGLVSSVVSISLGAIAGLDSSSATTIGVAGAIYGDLIFIQPVGSLWSAAAFDLTVIGTPSSTTTGEVNVRMINSAATSVTVAADNYRVLRLSF